MKLLTAIEKNKIFYFNAATPDICSYVSTLLTNGWARLTDSRDKYGSAVTEGPDAVSFDLSTAVKKAVTYYYSPEKVSKLEYKKHMRDFILLVEDMIVQQSRLATIMPQSLTTIDAFNDHPSVKLSNVLNLFFTIHEDYKKYTSHA